MITIDKKTLVTRGRVHDPPKTHSYGTRWKHASALHVLSCAASLAQRQDTPAPRVRGLSSRALSASYRPGEKAAVETVSRQQLPSKQ